MWLLLLSVIFSQLVFNGAFSVTNHRDTFKVKVQCFIIFNNDVPIVTSATGFLWWLRPFCPLLVMAFDCTRGVEEEFGKSYKVTS